MADPKFPPELERAIFEIVALSHPTTALKLVQVASRVKDWVEPLLYRVLYVTSEPDSNSLILVLRPQVVLRLITSKPHSFFQSAVKTLHIGGIFSRESAAIIPKILAACTGVTSLVITLDVTEHLASLNALRSLSSLSVGLEPIFRYHPMDFPQPMFHNITHLEIRESFWVSEATQKLCAGLALLPRLTHLSFSQVEGIDRLHLRLRNTPLPRLVCIVILAQVDYERKSHWPASDDPRFVTVAEEATWEKRQRDLIDGKSYWPIAEAFIAAKRAGKIREPWGRAPDRMSDGWWIR